MAQITVNDAAKSQKKIFGMTLGSFLGRFGPLFGLVLLTIFLSVTSDVFLTGSNLHQYRPPGDRKCLPGDWVC